MGAAATVSKLNLDGNQSKKSVDMACEICNASVNIFTRKKCSACSRYHCSKCLASRTITAQKICLKCQMLASGMFTRQDLAKYTTKELRQFLDRKNISVNSCTEKADLVELILQKCSRFNNRDDVEHLRHVEQLKEKMKNENQSIQSSTSSPQTQRQAPQIPSSSSIAPATFRDQEAVSRSSATPSPSLSTSNRHNSSDSGAPVANSINNPRAFLPGEPAAVDRNTAEEIENPSNASSRESPSGDTQTQEQSDEAGDSEIQSVLCKRTMLDDIRSVSEISNLSIRQLKELLVTNYVDYKGCCEKQELLDRVQRLWMAHSKNREIADDIEQVASNDLCKICMDAVIDCILLECGHMITCTNCGKRMAECPICRHYVSRVVHVFRA